MRLGSQLPLLSRLAIDGCSEFRITNELDKLELIRHGQGIFDSINQVPRVRKLRLAGTTAAEVWLSLHLGIQDLSLSYAPKVEHLSCPPLLSSLYVFVCKRLSSIEVSHHLAAMTLIDAGRLPSVESWRGLASLRHLHLGGGTTIVDGDLTPIADLIPQLASLFISNRRHYNLQLQAFGRSPLLVAPAVDRES